MFKSFFIRIVGLFLLGALSNAQAVPISMAKIDFSEAVASRFVMDNLVYDGGVLDFSEVPFQPVDGLTVNGVTFGFSIGGSSSSDANYNSGGPGVTPLTIPPQLEGAAAGILTIAFAAPTELFGFDLVLSTSLFSGVGAMVELFDVNGSTVLPVNVSVPVGSGSVPFAEGHFGSSVPEPGTIALFGLGLAWLGFARKKKV